MEEADTRINEFLEERVREDHEEKNKAERQEDQARSAGPETNNAQVDGSAAPGAGALPETANGDAVVSPFAPPGERNDPLPTPAEDTDDEGDKKEKTAQRRRGG